jgi:hypothetical protein
LRVFEDRVLRRIYGPKREETTEEWRKLHNEEINDPYCSPNVLGLIKKNEMRGTSSAYGGGRYVYRVWWENLRERDHWGDAGIDGKIILWRVFKKSDVRVWTGSIWFRIGTGGGLL